MMKHTYRLMVVIICTVLMCGCSNNEYNPPEEYLDKIGKSNFVHFSVDDTIDVLEDLTNNKNKYTSIFDNAVLGFMKELHDEYGIVVSFYVFYSWDVEEENFDLSEVTDKFAEEFKANADWLKWGFHAKDAKAYENEVSAEVVEYYNLTMQEFHRIFGDKQCLDHFVRLDRYSAREKTIKDLSDCAEGVVGLFIAEEQPEYRQSYYLSEKEMHTCYEQDYYYDEDCNIRFTPTDIRLENIENDDDFYKKLAKTSVEPYMIVFTHEWQFKGEQSEKVKKYMRWVAEYAKEKEVQFAFPEFVIK